MYHKMAKKVVYDWDWVDQQIDSIGEKLESIEKPQFITGVPRGGLIPAVLMSHKFEIPFIGDLMHQSWLHYAFSWSGAVYDIFVVFFLVIFSTGLCLKLLDKHNDSSKEKVS